MTQAEKLKAALADRLMDEITLARMMRISPGYLIGVTRGWAVLQDWEQKWVEETLGLEPGTLTDAGGQNVKECGQPIRPASVLPLLQGNGARDGDPLRGPDE